MSSIEPISAQACVELLLELDPIQPSCGLVDVRAPVEFALGSLPWFQNVAVLDDSQRAAVGTAYKTKGREVAIALGHQLTSQTKTEMVRRILSLAADDGLVVTCFRGGLRSQITCQWLREASPTVRIRRVVGGYKEVRGLLFGALKEPPFSVRVLSGLTGSGKTAFLHTLDRRLVPLIDLEAHANHRGSSFGSLGPQPRQINFEHAVALDALQQMRALPGRPILLEDESKLIGHVALPDELKQAMVQAPHVVLQCTLDERVQRIFLEYVAQPFVQMVATESVESVVAELKSRHLASLKRIEKKLGSARTGEIASLLNTAFLQLNNESPRLESHAGWISALLVDYYDKRYTYARERSPRHIVFEGDAEQCRSFLLG